MNQPKKNEKLISEPTPQTTENVAVKENKFTFKNQISEGVDDIENQYKTNDRNPTNQLKPNEYQETNEGEPPQVLANLSPKTPGSEENPLIKNNFNPQLTNKTKSETTPAKKEQFKALDFKQNKIRKGFILKTFSIVGIQLGFVSVCIIFPLVFESVSKWMSDNWWLAIVTSVLALIILYTVVYSKVGRMVPINYILLCIFTLLEAYSISYVAAISSPETVGLAAGCTMVIVIALAVFAKCTKKDFTGCGPYLLVLIVGLIASGTVAYFFRNKIVTWVICSIAVLVFGCYLVFDIQLIVNKRNSNKFAIDDYIIAAMMVQTDIVGIFVTLINLIRNR
jgi:FtsH-binding integral membrane protein